MKFANIDGLTIHYSDNGQRDRPVLVFANSLGTDFRIWNQVAAGFGRRFRTICYDKRGHGLSDAPIGPYSLQDHVDDLQALLTQLGVDTAALAGVSVGGMIALLFCTQHSDRVSALVLCDTAARIGTAGLWNERITRVRGSGLVSIADAVLERWFSAEFRQRRETDFGGWRNMLIRTPAEGYASTCAAIRDADLGQSTPLITRPALVVCGEHDGATPPDLVRSLAESIPGARFEIIRDAGHLPSIEQPEILFDLMDNFFKENEIG
jgi:3-oxoadipate enol-lactonase